MACDPIRRNWLHTWCVLAVVSATAQGAPGWASEPVPAICTPGDPSRCAQPLEKGQPAPFQGQLLSTELAIDLGQKATWCDQRLDLGLKHAKALADLDLTLAKQLRENDRVAWEAEKKLLLDRLEEEKNSGKWYTHPIFVATVSILSTALISYGMFEIARHAP